MLKWKWRVVVAAVVVAVACLFHAPLFRGLASPLIVDQTTDDFDVICLLGDVKGPDGDRCYDVAGDLFPKNPADKILIVAPPPDRVVEAGALPSFETISRRELAARGVPRESITILRSRRLDDWASAEALDGWLRDHPESSVLLLCGQFHSARVRAVLDDALDPARAARVRVRSLPDRRFDQTNWWRSRCGVRELGKSWLVRIQGWLGGSADPPPSKNANDYQREIMQAWQEATP